MTTWFTPENTRLIIMVFLFMALKDVPIGDFVKLAASSCGL
jgi:hypothetical protein